MFRDHGIASREKEIAQLRDALAESKERNEDLQEDLEEAQTKSRRSNWFKDWLAHRREVKSRRRSYGRRFSFNRVFNVHVAFMALVFLGITGMIGVGVYQYFTDIQEGVVTSKAYHPPETVCTTDENGYTSCTTYPEHWTVDIAYEGQTATWGVSHGEFNELDRGEWYCYTDLLHSAEDCHGEPSD
jgi:hypothetical protein